MSGYISASRSLALFTATLQAVTAMIKTTDLQQLINRLKHESEAAKALMIEYGLLPRKNRNSARPARLPVRRATGPAAGRATSA